jgi:hypothetical protein
MEHSEAYQKGYDAYLGSMKDKVNPYRPDSRDADEWQAGYNHAQADCAW